MPSETTVSQCHCLQQLPVSSIILLKIAKLTKFRLLVNSRDERLTPRERECLSLISRKDGVKAVAREIGITSYTVQKHLSNARRKLGVTKTLHAVAIVHQEEQMHCEWIEHSQRTESLSVEACCFESDLCRVSSAEEGLSILQSYTASIGCPLFLIGLVAEPFGQLTNGASIVASTVEEEILELYNDGGANRDPIANRVSTSRHPFEIESDVVLSKHFAALSERTRNLSKRMRDIGSRRILVLPNADLSTGAPFSLTLSLDKHLEKERLLDRPGFTTEIRFITTAYWRFLKANGTLARSLKLSEIQIEGLNYVARGFRTEEIADRLGVSARQVGYILSTTREKLGAATNAAAVFRANVYGLF